MDGVYRYKYYKYKQKYHTLKAVSGGNKSDYKFKLVNNLFYMQIPDSKQYGFVDTGGITTFLFRNQEMLNKISKNIKFKLIYTQDDDIDFLSPQVVLFIGQDYFKNKIVLFDYLNKSVKFVTRIPDTGIIIIYPISFKNKLFPIIKVVFEGKENNFLLDTGATNIKNKKNIAISFIDGTLFDSLVNKGYKLLKNYDDDGSPAVVVPEIKIFGKTVKDVLFLKRPDNAFLKWMSSVTGVRHIGAIGGNVLKDFTFMIDYKDKELYVSDDKFSLSCNPLYHDTHQQDIPQSFTKYMPHEAVDKSLVCEVKHKNKTVLVARLYFLTPDYKKSRGITHPAKYELGDVYLYPEYRGKKDKGSDKKYSQLCLEMILDKYDNLILWTVVDNLPAIKRYEQLGFKPVDATNRMRSWIHDVFGKDNEWIKNREILYMYYEKN